MTQYRILHVDDEIDIREVVALSLSLDPQFITRSCASGQEALAQAADWAPDLILCDVMMPVMDGPTTLAHLRETPQTSDIPVVFMTARQQARELEQFKSLGASGVLAKPFDPMVLAGEVRKQLWSAKMATAVDGFRQRLETDRAALIEYRAAMGQDPASPAVLRELTARAHKLAGAAGIFGADKVSRAASALEESAVERQSGAGLPGSVEEDIDALLACIAQA
jgi:CheY-like chemotaxis protein